MQNEEIFFLCKVAFLKIWKPQIFKETLLRVVYWPEMWGGREKQRNVVLGIHLVQQMLPDRAEEYVLLLPSCFSKHFIKKY